MSWLPIVYLTDCADDNAGDRLWLMLGSLFGQLARISPVANDIEAAGRLIDVLEEMSACQCGISLNNRAPRNGVDNWQGKQWDNGSPFGYFHFNGILVVCTIGGYLLSLIKQFGIAEVVNEVDIPKVLEVVFRMGEIDEKQKDMIAQTQFRSLHFLPRLASWLHRGIDLPHSKLSMDGVPDVGDRIWWIDNFGNGKLTIPVSRFSLQEGEEVRIGVPRHNGHIVPYHRHLKDVPRGQVALIEGSSGIGHTRLFELAQGGMGNASQLFHLQSGDEVTIERG